MDEIAVKIAGLKDEVLAERRLREDAELRLEAQRHITDTYRETTGGLRYENSRLHSKVLGLEFALVLAQRYAEALQKVAAKGDSLSLAS